VVNELTVAANPLKLREYLAAGLPVVATPLPEVLKLSALVRMARTPDEFLNEIEALLSEGKTGPDAAVAALMERESWDQKVEELSEIISNLDGHEKGRGRPLPARRVA
jgi:hypothetical protein